MLEFRFIYGADGFALSEDMRKNVFGKDAAVSDDYEGCSYHFIGYDKTVQIASARLTELGGDICKIAFVAVKEDYRRQYVGDLIMRALADKAVALGAKSVIIETTPDVQGFFEFEGYEVMESAGDGKTYIMMKKDLTKIQPCRGCGK